MLLETDAIGNTHVPSTEGLAFRLQLGIIPSGTTCASVLFHVYSEKKGEIDCVGDSDRENCFLERAFL